MTKKTPVFKIGEIIWAVVCAAAILTFAYTMTFFLNEIGVPFLFEPGTIKAPFFDEPSEGVVLSLRVISLFVLMACWMFYPSRHGYFSSQHRGKTID